MPPELLKKVSAVQPAVLPPVASVSSVSTELALEALQASANISASNFDKNGQLRLRISQIPSSAESTNLTQGVDSYVFDKSAISSGEKQEAGKLKKFIPSEEKFSKEGIKGNWVEVEQDTPRFYIVKSEDGNRLFLTDSNAHKIGELKIDGGKEALEKLKNNDLFLASGKLEYINMQGILVVFTIDGSNFSINANGKTTPAIIINGLAPSGKPSLNTKADPLSPLAEHQEELDNSDQRSTGFKPDLAGGARHIVTDLRIRRNIFSMPVGDYHIPAPEQREKSTLRETAIVAENILSADKLQKLYEQYEVATFEKQGEQSEQIGALYNKTIEAVNIEVSKTASLEVASDELRAKLGLPKGVQVLLARSGDLVKLGSMSEAQLDELITKAFRDSIVLRKIGDGAFASPEDIVVIQVHKQGGRGQLCLNMSHIHGTDQNRESWQVTSSDATYHSNPSPYIKDEIRRSSEKTEYSFSQWLETRESWTASSNSGKVLDGALRKREALCLQRDQATITERKKEEETLRLAASQSGEQAEFKKVREGYYVTSYQGWIISHEHRNNAAIGARDFRTGTIDFRAPGGVEFTIEDQDSKRVTSLRIDSYAQIKASSAKSKEFITHILTTPYENNPEESVRKIISLFPGQVYRPNELVALFSPPRYYVRELREEVARIYPGNGSPNEQRAFLEKLLSELAKNEKITEKSISKIISALRAE